MKIRDCKFCNNPATYAPLPHMENFNVKIFFCHPCQAEYLYYMQDGEPSNKPSSVSLYTTVSGRMFRWTVMAHGHGQLWKVGKPGIPGIKMNEDMEAVVHFDDLEGIQLTPKNIEGKIRSWLPFL